jgi:hypothetical protein
VKKRQTLTAAEFAAQLATNPEYQAGIAAQAARAAAIEAEAQPIVADLRAAGFSVSSVGELRLRYMPLPGTAVGILLRWLPRVTAAPLQDAIARDLANVTEPFNVQPLIALFERTSSESLRWSIANTLAELRPLDARGWIIQALERPEYGRAREMLLLALARIAPRDVANPVLLRHLDEMPGHVALGLAESGGMAEAEALRHKATREKGWVRKELQRAIRRIEKRDKNPS